MKLRKLLVCVLTAAVLFGTTGVTTYAAEKDNTTAAIATEEESTSEDKKVSITEKKEVKEVTKSTETKVVTTTKKETTTAKTTKTTKKETVKKSTKSTTKKTIKKSTKKSPARKYTSSDLKLMSSIIFCEAGAEPYAGKVAVGIVVKNRMESKSFPSTLKGVIYQKYQFGPVRNGALKKALAKYESGKFTSSYQKSSIRAAKTALSGEKKITYKGRKLNLNKYLYFSGRVSNAKLTIGGHQFK
ncbi:cell wall hydrolase [Velocimicrobium porci]|nr:cell wall hydrolase [Velocimicrobium porci]